MVTVHLTNGLYFVVSEHSFDLFCQEANKKSPKLLGYFNSLDSLIKKATQYSLHKLNGEADFTGFLRKWNEIQQELGDYVSKYKF